MASSSSPVETDQIESELVRSRELDVELAEMRRRLDDARDIPMNVNRHALDIRLNESRLHDYITRFNETLSQNTAIKENIEVLRREREMFENIRRKLMREIERKQGEIMFIVDKSKADNAARDLALSHMTHLKAQADREHAEFEKEWTELARLIENDKRMREFVQLKDAKNKQQSKRVSLSPSHITNTTSDDIGFASAQVESLAAQFDALRRATGTTSIDELLHFFVEKEKINFSLFNRVSEHLIALDRLNATVRYINDEVETYRSIGQQVESSKLTNRAEIERRSDDFTMKAAILHKLLSTLRITVQSIFEKTFGSISDFDRYLSPLVTAASASVPIGSVTEANVVDYLAAIEVRVDEMMASYHALFPPQKRVSSLGKGGARKSMLSSQQKTMHSLQTGPIIMTKMTQFRLPSVVGDEGEHEQERDGEVLRLLSRSELRARTLDSIQRGQEKHKKATLFK